MEIKRLSYTMIRTYLECPRAFDYHYIQGLPVVLTGRLVMGKTYHAGVAHALRGKMAGVVTAPDEIGDVIADAWEAELASRVIDEQGGPKIEAKSVDWQGEDPGKMKDLVIRLAVLYARRWVPKIEPVAVEVKLQGIIGGVPFVGYPDIQAKEQGKLGVIDHKLRSRAMGQADVDKDIQLTSYAALLQQPIWAAFHQALTTKRPRIIPLLTQRSQSDIEWFERLVTEVWRAIQTGIFPPNPLTWKCNRDCWYNIECRVLHEW
jgi:CRISPR/Cas system-associated exonuclease Cas4 (RecB family)